MDKYTTSPVSVAIVAKDYKKIRDKYGSLIDHPAVSRLSNISQLSFVNRNSLTASAGDHTRFEHSLHAYLCTEEITESLLEKGDISNQQKRNLENAALLHDIGHPPFSHVTEYVLGKLGRGKNHKQMAIEFIENKGDRFDTDLETLVEDHEGEPEVVKQIIVKENELSEVISHAPLGTDKMSYLLMDSWKANLSFHDQLKGVISNMSEKYRFDKGNLCIEPKSPEKYWINDFNVLVDLYQKMYKEVYNNPESEYSERLIEKGVERLIKEGICSPAEIWEMGDLRLRKLLKHREETNGIFDKIRRIGSGKEVLSIKPRNLPDGKKLAECYIKDELRGETNMENNALDFIDFYSNPMNRSKAEREIRNKMGYDEDKLITVLNLSVGALFPDDVIKYGGRQSLFQKRPGILRRAVENVVPEIELTVYRTDEERTNETEKEAIEEVIEHPTKFI